MMEVWTDRVTMWNHYECHPRDPRVHRPEYIYPESEPDGPRRCPLCGVLLCGCCPDKVATYISTGILRFRRNSPNEDFVCLGFV